MADFQTTASRVGEINNGGDALALFLKVFPGEVLGSFNDMNKIMPLHMTRTISQGKSAQFPVIGKTSAAYHVAGAELAGTQILHNERVISIDSMLVADTFVADIDEAMNHYQVRGEYAKQMGEALAKKADQQLLQVAGLAARAATTITGQDGGTGVVSANSKTVGADLATAIGDVTQAFDEKNVPDSERYVAVKPAQYYLMAETTDLINRDYGNTGVLEKAQIEWVRGMQIVKTNNLPTTNIAAESGANNTYDGDFTNTAAICWHPTAMGTVMLVGLKTEAEYLIRYQGTLMVAKYAMGHGILRPESAGEITTA